MSKYNFNPTPEQLADPKFWASDEVPEGAERFKPECNEWTANYLKFDDGCTHVFVKGCDHWLKIPSAIESWKEAIKRPADQNALKRCPCGQVPNSLIIQEFQEDQVVLDASPACCSYWNFNFSAEDTDKEQETMDSAIKAWNALPRGFE